MLTGSDLLTKVKELGDVSKSDLVRSCGYVSDKKDGGERLNFTAFYEALLEAKGVNLGVGGAGVARVAANCPTWPPCRATAICSSARPTRLCSISNPVTSLRSSLGASRFDSSPLAAATKTKSESGRVNHPAASLSCRQNSPAWAAAELGSVAAIRFTKALPTMAPSAPQDLT